MTTDPHSDRAVALAFLAASPGGVTEAAVVAAGFSVQLVTALVRDGLATGERDADRWTWSSPPSACRKRPRLPAAPELSKWRSLIPNHRGAIARRVDRVGWCGPAGRCPGLPLAGAVALGRCQVGVFSPCRGCVVWRDTAWGPSVDTPITGRARGRRTASLCR